jgi:protein TonB
MKLGVRLHIKRDKAIGLTLVLLLHFLGLYGLWSYRIIPPPEEALVVFAHFINPPPAARRAEPAAPKPVKPVKLVPIRKETPRHVPPVTEHLLISAAPVTSPAEPVAPPPPVVPASPEPVTVSSPATATSIGTQGSSTEDGSGSKPVLLAGDLSVSCSERTAPDYPKLSIRRNEQGKTILLVELDELGRVVNVTIKKKSGFPRLDEAAIAAVKTWRCTPAKRNGAAVHAIASQPFNFTLKGP